MAVWTELEVEIRCVSLLGILLGTQSPQASNQLLDGYFEPSDFHHPVLVLIGGYMVERWHGLIWG